MTESLGLDASLLCNLAIGRVLKDSEAPVLGLDFSGDGHLLAAYTADTLTLYDTATVKRVKTLKNTVSRIAFLRFTHSPTLVVFVPAEDPQDVLLWSVFENEIIKSFRGPIAARVTGLSLSPTSDLLLTTDSRNDTRIYDLAAMDQDPQTLLQMPWPVESLAAAFDWLGEGVLVAYARLLGSARSVHVSHFGYKDGAVKPLATLRLGTSDPPVALRADFHGRTLAVLDRKNVISVVQASLKRALFQIRMPPLLGSPACEFGYSPDSRFLVSGEEDASLKIYDAEKGAEIARYANHAGACLCARFSPTAVLLASACHKVILWIPKYWEKS